MRQFLFPLILIAFSIIACKKDPGINYAQYPGLPRSVVDALERKTCQCFDLYGVLHDTLRIASYHDGDLPTDSSSIENFRNPGENSVVRKIYQNCLLAAHQIQLLYMDGS